MTFVNTNPLAFRCDEIMNLPCRIDRRGLTEDGGLVKRILVPVLAGLTLAACGGEPDPPPRATVAGATPSATVVLADCGTYELSQGDEVPESAARCLVEAVGAGRPARLKVTRPTTEGDPIPVTYTAGADGRVEVITDSRQDNFGAKVVTRHTCTGPVATPRLDFTHCAEPTPVS
jgi:hypothetical protein